MFEKYIVKRSSYDRDIAELRNRLAETNKQLREQEKLKAEANLAVKSFDKERQMLHREIEQLNKRLKVKVSDRDLAEYMNPVPKGDTARAQYMAQVAGFFEGGLRDKLNYMHSQFKNQTGMFPLNERETDFFRSCINVVGLLLDWGEECVAEHHANIANANQLGEGTAFDEHDEGEEAVQNIKSKLNE